MTSHSSEGIFRKDAGTVDSEGFIAPEIGLVDHALHFNRAPDVVAKTRQVIDEDRLELPGAVVVWNESIGRRKGSKAVPGSWWAAQGSVCLALVFARKDLMDPENAHREAVAGVLAAISSFSPNAPVLAESDGLILLDGKRLGRLDQEAHGTTEIFVVHINACTDFSQAPPQVRETNSRLIDHIDERELPLSRSSTLPNTLSLAIMREVPSRLVAIQL